MKSLVYKAILPLAVIWVGSVSAEPAQKLDDHGRVILDERKDGIKDIHTYAPDGERIKSETSQGERIHFDKHGHVVSGSSSSSIPAESRVQP